MTARREPIPAAMASLVGHLLYGVLLGLAYVRVASGGRVGAASGAYSA